jgi:CheY-like chemotaxis protein
LPDDKDPERSDAGEPSAEIAISRKERRRHPRRRVALPAKLEIAKGKRVECTIIDLSSHGARLRLMEPLRDGDLVRLVSPQIGKMRARVVWATPDFLAGLEYIGRDGLTSTQAGLPKVLVVDDEKIALDVLRRMLERSGYAVVPATSGRQALQLFRERQIDLAIIDLLMPVMDGFQLINELLATQANLRIIAVSGAGLRLEMALKFGAKAILRKPVTLKDLIHTVRQAFSDSKFDEADSAHGD